MIYHSLTHSLTIHFTLKKVRLIHIPTNISVYCHEARDLSTNRKIARRLLREKVELHLFGSQSKIAQRIEKLQERKKRANRRSQKKYHGNNNSDTTTNNNVETSEENKDDDYGIKKE